MTVQPKVHPLLFVTIYPMVYRHVKERRCLFENQMPLDHWLVSMPKFEASFTVCSSFFSLLSLEASFYLSVILSQVLLSRTNFVEKTAKEDKNC